MATMNRLLTLATMHVALLLLLLACGNNIASAKRPGKQDQQCTTPGTCSDNPVVDDSDDSSDDDSGDAGDNDYAGFLEYLLNGVEPYELPEMHEALSDMVENAGVTTMMQKHIERLLIGHQFPNNGDDAKGKALSYRDSGAPKYASFGSLLDLSTVYSASWGGSTEFGGKPGWIASVFYRKDIIEHERKVPCPVYPADDCDDNDRDCCLLGVTIDDYVAVRGSEDKKREHMEIAADWDILDNGEYRAGNIIDLKFDKKTKFDTIVANGAVAAVPDMLDGMDQVLERLVSLLKPGGMIFLVGIEPLLKEKENEAGKVYNSILEAWDSMKTRSGEQPTHNLPVTWINDNLKRLGLNVFSSTIFPVEPSFEDVAETVNEANDWIDEHSRATKDIKKQNKKKLANLLDDLRGVVARNKGPILAGENQYIIAAELPAYPSDEKKLPAFPSDEKKELVESTIVGDPYELPEMHEALSDMVENAGVTTMMQKHIERLLIGHQFPNNNGNNAKVNSDSDSGAPKYASFGSLLDLSTVYSASWGGSTEFGGKPGWVASVFHRKDIIEHERKVPCRMDLADDYDADANDRDCCLLGVSIDDYVAVRGSEDKKREHMEIAADWDILDKGEYRAGNIMDLNFDSKTKFDTIVANGVVAAVPDILDDMDQVLEKLVSLLKPGGVIFFIGIEPLLKEKANEAGKVYNSILEAWDSIKIMSGEQPTHNLPATWINRTLHRLGLNVFSSTIFPVEPSFEDVAETVNEADDWIEEHSRATKVIKKQYKKRLENLLNDMGGVVARNRGPIFAGEHQYIIAAELPAYPSDEKKELVESTFYQPKQKQ